MIHLYEIAWDDFILFHADRTVTQTGKKANFSWALKKFSLGKLNQKSLYEWDILFKSMFNWMKQNQIERVKLSLYLVLFHNRFMKLTNF